MPREIEIDEGMFSSTKDTQIAANQTERAGAQVKQQFSDMKASLRGRSEEDVRGGKPTGGGRSEEAVLGGKPMGGGRSEEFPDPTAGMPPEGVELVDPRMEVETAPSYGDEEEEFLFGATSRPDEPANFGVTTLKPQPPKNVYRYLSALAEAAEDPDAPEQVHGLIRVLNDMLTEEG